MKQNLRLVPVHELPLPGHSAFWYETTREKDEQCDFHLTLYREEEISAWITLCPTENPDVLQLCNRYMSEEDQCNAMEEKALNYVENWARLSGYKQVFVNACETSVPFYVNMGYEQEGKTFYEGEVLMHKMVKML